MRFRTVSTLICAAALLAACGGDTIVGSDDGGQPSSDTTSTTTVTSTSPSPLPTTTTAVPSPSSTHTDPADVVTSTTTTNPAPATTLASDGSPPAAPRTEGEVPQEMLDRVLDDAAGRLGTDALEVTISEAVQWPDGALGCPEAGVLYTQAITFGYHVVIEGGGATIDYRLTADGSFRICERPGASPRSTDS